MALALDMVFAFLILNRVRLAWMLVIAGAVIDIVRVLASTPHWWLALADALLLALLLSSPSRRYMAKSPH